LCFYTNDLPGDTQKIRSRDVRFRTERIKDLPRSGNERCDELATAAILELKQRFTKEQLAASLREFNAKMKAVAEVDLLPLG